MWSIVIMGVADSWIFSAHVVVGMLSDNKTSLPMLVPGFLCLCTAVVFGPVSTHRICSALISQRYAVLLHRIQAPERVTPPPPSRAMPVTPALPPNANSADAAPPLESGTPPFLDRIRAFSSEQPAVKCEPTLVERTDH